MPSLYTFIYLEQCYIFISVCPGGFDWLDGQGCVALITKATSKSDALAECQKMNEKASLFMPKTDYITMKYRQYLASKGVNKTQLF